MLDFLKKLFKRKSKSVVGIDIGASSIKVVQIKEKLGKPYLETYGVISLGPFIGKEIGRSATLSNAKLGSALSDILQESQITTNRGNVAIPFSSSLVSVIQVPDVPEAEFETMIPIESRKYIPVPISEVTINWLRISPEEDGKGAKKELKKAKTEKAEAEAEAEEKKQAGDKKGSDKSSSGKDEDASMVDVLITVIHNNTISKFQSIAKNAEINIDFFEIEVFSTIRSVLDEEDLARTVMVMDMGASSTKLYIVDKGVVMKSHTINTGSEKVTEIMAEALGISFTEAEEKKRREGVLSSQRVSEAVSTSLDFLFLEIRRVVENFYKDYDKKVEKVILVGGGGATEGFASMAAANMELPVVYGDPFFNIETPDQLKEVIKYIGPEFSAAAGIALRGLEEG